eukprot:TRINITY_DN10804_c0_g1_i1.p1 TRINITY_DN10804_c0_g1~~TRINITY_DN10804_c0_g1_i1.p1  ORF type:complete len:459 (+),score=90.52 TRINITY_DN10804_c0_g1_i1:37-1377(+)
MLSQAVSLCSLCILLLSLVSTGGAVPATETYPKSVHLAFTGNATSMSVSWWTESNEGVTNPSVVYGPSSNNYTMKVSATAATYNSTNAGYVYNAIMDGLVADGKQYYYRVSTDQESEEFSFESQAVTDRPSTVIMYADMGVRDSEQTIMRVLKEVNSGGIDFIYHTGDISYADDQPCNVYEYVWSEWFNMMETASASIPYMVTPGNHEYQCNAGQVANYMYTQNFTAYQFRFQMPSYSSNGAGNMWYSFDYLNTHYIALSTETDFKGAPEQVSLFGDQVAWFEADLQAVDRSVTPWVIVTGHRPMYSTDPGSYDMGTGEITDSDMKALMAAFEGLFKKYSVDLYVMGHVHAYERMYPVYNNTVTSTSYVNPTDTVHIVNGAGGNEEGPTVYLSQMPTGAPWLAHRYSGWGYAKLNIPNATTLEWTFIRASDGGVEDTMTITKTAPA